MKKVKLILGTIFLGYLCLDCFVGNVLWNIKEGLVGCQILWFQLPLTNIIYYKESIKWLSTLPSFSIKLVHQRFLSGIFLIFCATCVATWAYFQSPSLTQTPKEKVNDNGV